MSCKRKDTWQRWKKELLVWKCALEVGCYLASVIPCALRLPHIISIQQQGEGTDGEKPAPCSCSETEMLLLTPSPDTVMEQISKPKITNHNCQQPSEHMSVWFTVPEQRERSLGGVSAKVVAQCHFSPVSYALQNLSLQNKREARDPWISLTSIFFIMEHHLFQSLGSVQNEISIERKKFLIILQWIWATRSVCNLGAGTSWSLGGNS